MIIQKIILKIMIDILCELFEKKMMKIMNEKIQVFEYKIAIIVM
jgi:hypothetical protein